MRMLAHVCKEFAAITRDDEATRKRAAGIIGFYVGGFLSFLKEAKAVGAARVKEGQQRERRWTGPLTIPRASGT